MMSSGRGEFIIWESGCKVYCIGEFGTGEAWNLAVGHVSMSHYDCYCHVVHHSPRIGFDGQTDGTDGTDRCPDGCLTGTLGLILPSPQICLHKPALGET